MIPLDTKKQLLIDQIAPVIKQLSPKWGEAIISILKSLDISKLVPLFQSDKELEKKVKEEEALLEAEERKAKDEEARRHQRLAELAEQKKKLGSSS